MTLEIIFHPLITVLLIANTGATFKPITHQISKPVNQYLTLLLTKPLTNITILLMEV